MERSQEVWGATWGMGRGGGIGGRREKRNRKVTSYRDRREFYTFTGNMRDGSDKEFVRSV